MQVILTETIETLGIIGTEVKVADGYARNYLIPQNKAVLATPQNRKILDQQKAKIELQIAKEKSLAEEMAARIKDVEIVLTAKVSDETKLYGSIATNDIRDALMAQHTIEVDRKRILLDAPIKETGEYKVPIRVYTDVEPEIIVKVEPEV
ncbi:MAG: 50S ribosomal protein L9 [Deltaproteobacteria bacterium]|nr:MAG: 50S ribosomal protein L9 [Deltaproteobacteria bacterium]